MKKVALLFAAAFLLHSGSASSECVVHGSTNLIPFYTSFPLIAEGKVLEVANKLARDKGLDDWPLRLTKFKITTFLKAPRKRSKYPNRSQNMPDNVYWMLMQDRDLHIGDHLLVFATLETADSALISTNIIPAGQSRIWVADNGSCDSSLYRSQSVEAVTLKRRVIQRLKKGWL